MFALVSVLDQTHCALVEGLWDALQQEFGLQSVYTTPYPHISYHVAQRYDVERLEADMARLARQLPPLTIQTSGLGLFTARPLVLYVPIVRAPQLAALHQTLFTAALASAEGPLDYYRPEHWMPHITLAHSDLTPENLPEIVKYLTTHHTFEWNIPLDSLALICEQCGEQNLQGRVALTGGRP